MQKRNKRMAFLVWLMLGLLLLPLLAAPASAALGEPRTPVPTAAVRNKPTWGHIIGYLPQGTSLTVLGQSGDYFEIDCYDMTGYIHKTNVECREDEYYVNCSGSIEGKFFYARSVGEMMALKGDLYERALSVVGVPYVSGGSGPKGFDCSGFTSWLYRAYGEDIGRVCDQQLCRGIIIPKENLQCGDVVLFQNTAPGSGISSHVGIYLGDGKLAHAGSRGITVVELESNYFREHYLCSRRMVLMDAPEPEWTPLIQAAIRSMTMDD